jgi:hypothetical protein
MGSRMLSSENFNLDLKRILQYSKGTNRGGHLYLN